MKKVIFITYAALVFLAGCGSADNNASGIPGPPKWKGAPYQLTIGEQPAEPNSTGLTIPQIYFTANPDMLENRANLAVEFDASGANGQGAATIQMVMGAMDLQGSKGMLPAGYVDQAGAAVSNALATDCVKGKVKIEVALTRSSISPNPTRSQIDAHRISDWTPIEVEFKNPHPKC